ncbi:Protein CBFA2T3, partial [Armadillidium vulgare]
MLTCILSMVEKTRRALTMLQQREDRESSTGGGRCSSSLSDGRSRSEYDAEVRRHATELVAHAIRSTEDRVAEVKRKAEEAVIEVRKAAVAEVQRAVASAESKAQELVNAERNRIEGLMRELARRESSGDHKVEAQLACWNCGRKAQDTCSGCNVAKYCSPFCQHKDWDHHHKVCSPALATSSVVKVSCKVHKQQQQQQQPQQQQQHQQQQQQQQQQRTNKNRAVTNLKILALIIYSFNIEWPVTSKKRNKKR